jgi:hypothetical protein
MVKQQKQYKGKMEEEERKWLRQIKAHTIPTVSVSQNSRGRPELMMNLSRLHVLLLSGTLRVLTSLESLHLGLANQMRFASRIPEHGPDRPGHAHRRSASMARNT